MGNDTIREKAPTLLNDLKSDLKNLTNDKYYYGGAEKSFLTSVEAQLITGICAFLAFIISSNLIVKHLRYYTKPNEQRWILRLIFIVPIYAITSWISLLLFGQNAQNVYLYLDTIRSCYEAFVIYCFLSLCFDGYLGGEQRIVSQLDGQAIPSTYRTLTCCLKNQVFSRKTLRFCKQATLQFCYIKIFITIITLVLQSKDKLHPGNFSPAKPYIYIMLCQNLSVTTALWSLALFYLTTKELLSPYSPLLKFITVKSVIFLAFWQGVFIVVLKSLDIIHDIGNIPKDVVASGWQHFFTACEMLIAAIAFWYAFTYKVYVQRPSPTSCQQDLYSNQFFSVARPPSVNALAATLTQSLDVRDVIRDTVHNFGRSQPYRQFENESGTQEQGEPKKTEQSGDEQPISMDPPSFRELSNNNKNPQEDIVL